MNMNEMSLSAIEEQIAIVSSNIESCKRAMRTGDEARKRYVELLNQLDILAAAYIAKRGGGGSK